MSFLRDSCHEDHLDPGDISQHVASFLPRQPEHVCDGYPDEESPRRLRFALGFVCDSVPRETHLEWVWQTLWAGNPNRIKVGEGGRILIPTPQSAGV